MKRYAPRADDQGFSFEHGKAFFVPDNIDEVHGPAVRNRDSAHGLRLDPRKHLRPRSSGLQFAACTRKFSPRHLMKPRSRAWSTGQFSNANGRACACQPMFGRHGGRPTPPYRCFDP